MDQRQQFKLRSKDSTHTSEDSNNLIRLSKLMTEKGICSRREADSLIERGLVFVNGERISTLGHKVAPNVRVTLDAEALRSQKNLVTVILNKPVGIVSNLPEKGYQAAIDLITPDRAFLNSHKVLPTSFWRQIDSGDKNLAVVGRLDIESQGLLILTQDGRLVKSIIGDASDTEKEYLVRVKGSLSEESLNLLREGIELDGKVLKRAEVEWLNQDQLKFILREGKKRQIRRMCEAVGLTVLGLKRVRIGKLKLGSLPEGFWRPMTDDEKKYFL
jgi:23S rRNA pseudouridine2604 synthase